MKLLNKTLFLPALLLVSCINTSDYETLKKVSEVQLKAYSKHSEDYNTFVNTVTNELISLQKKYSDLVFLQLLEKEAAKTEGQVSSEFVQKLRTDVDAKLYETIDGYNSKRDEWLNSPNMKILGKVLNASSRLMSTIGDAGIEITSTYNEFNSIVLGGTSNER